MLRRGPAALAALLRAPGGGRSCRERSGGALVRWFCSASPPQPVVAATEPFPVELEAGKTYGWCSCGHSKRQPFCDGAHKKAAPGLSPVRFSPAESGPALLCGCKRTRSPPFCDGSHRELPGSGVPEPPEPDPEHPEGSRGPPEPHPSLTRSSSRSATAPTGNCPGPPEPDPEHPEGSRGPPNLTRSPPPILRRLPPGTARVGGPGAPPSLTWSPPSLTRA